MKFTVPMKTPDAMTNAIRRALPRDTTDEDAAAIIDEETVLCDRWFQCGEFVEIAVDTDAMTATVELRRTRP